MSITDELRKEARGFGRYVYTAPQADCLTAIADRIDAEHEAACAEAYGNGVMSVPIALDESQWVKLPVSEDGDVLHIGELVDEKLPFGGYAAPAPIDTMELSRGAGWYRWMVKLDAENRALISPRLLRHHHAPTVEDVLRDFTDEVWNRCCEGATASDSGIDELVAECAAKLRLAGDAE